jgi:hypothetical protein
MIKLVASWLWFNIFWLVTVMKGGDALWMAVVLLVVGFAFLERSMAEYTAVLAIALVGISVDFLLVATRVLQFELYPYAPPWLAVLWVGFGIMCRVGLKWSAQLNSAVRGLIFSIAGVFSYVVAMELSGASFGVALSTGVFTLASVWFVYGVVIRWVFIDQLKPA